jgi:hypothetical protein
MCFPFRRIAIRESKTRYAVLCSSRPRHRETEQRHFEKIIQRDFRDTLDVGTERVIEIHPRTRQPLGFRRAFEQFFHHAGRQFRTPADFALIRFHN